MAKIGWLYSISYHVDVKTDGRKESMLSFETVFIVVILLYIFIFFMAYKDKKQGVANSKYKDTKEEAWSKKFSILADILIIVTQIIIVLTLFMLYPMQRAELSQVDEDKVSIIMALSLAGFGINVIALWINRKCKVMLFFVILTNIYMVYKYISTWMVMCSFNRSGV